METGCAILPMFKNFSPHGVDDHDAAPGAIDRPGIEGQEGPDLGLREPR